VLLKTIGKIIKKIITKRIRKAIKAKNLLPLKQIGARTGHNTNITLKLLTNIIKTI